MSEANEKKDNKFESLLTITLKQQKIIDNLESQKAELIESIKKAISDLNEKGLNHDMFVGWVIDDLKTELKKHGVEI